MEGYNNDLQFFPTSYADGDYEGQQQQQNFTGTRVKMNNLIDHL